MVSKKLTLASSALAALLCVAVPSFAQEHAPAASRNQSSTPLATTVPAIKRFERRLSGVWASKDTSHGAAEGAMNLKRDGRVVLAIAPVGGVVVPPLTGWWHADARRIEITIPKQGTAVLHYRLSPHGLDIVYPNGIRQHFYKYTKRTPPGKAGHA